MATVSITESNVLTALRTFILSLVTCEVVQGLGNRSAMPPTDFIAMTPLSMTIIETNVSTYSDAPGNGTQNVMRPTRLDVQIDCYGSTAFDRATIISTMLRSEYACNSFAASGFDVQPLYADDPKQLPFINGEDQYEQRFTFAAALQFNPVVTVPQDFATALNFAAVKDRKSTRLN